MDRVPVANLEAELGHLDEESPHVGQYPLRAYHL